MSNDHKSWAAHTNAARKLLREAENYIASTREGGRSTAGKCLQARRALAYAARAHERAEMGADHKVKTRAKKVQHLADEAVAHVCVCKNYGYTGEHANLGGVRRKRRR